MSLKLSQLENDPDEIGIPTNNPIEEVSKPRAKRKSKNQEQVTGITNDPDAISTMDRENTQVELTYPNIKNVWTDEKTLKDLLSPTENSTIKPIDSPEGIDPKRLVGICNRLFLFPTPEEYFLNSINRGVYEHPKYAPIANEISNSINRDSVPIDLNTYKSLINTTYGYLIDLTNQVSGGESSGGWQTEVPNAYLRVSNWIIAKNRIPELAYELQSVRNIWSKIYYTGAESENFDINNIKNIQYVYETLSNIYNNLIDAVQNNQTLPSQQQLNNIILKGIPLRSIPSQYKTKTILRDIPRTEATFVKFIQTFIKERTRPGRAGLELDKNFKTLPLAVPGIGTIGPDSIKTFFESGENLSNFNAIKDKVGELTKGIYEGRFSEEELSGVERSIHNIIWRQFGQTSVSGDIVNKTRKIENPLIGDLYPSIKNAGDKLMQKLGYSKPDATATKEDKYRYLGEMANNPKILQAIFEFNKSKLINASKGLINSSDEDVIANVSGTYDEDEELTPTEDTDEISDVGGTVDKYIPNTGTNKNVIVKDEPDGSSTYYLQDKKGKESLLYNTKDLVSTILLAPAIQKAISISANRLPKPEVNENNKQRGEGLYTTADLTQLGFMTALTAVGKYGEDSKKSLVGTVMNRVKSVCTNYINRSLKGLDEKSTKLSRLANTYAKRYGGSQRNFNTEDVTKYIKDCLISESSAKAISGFKVGNAYVGILPTIKKDPGIDLNSLQELLKNYVIDKRRFSKFSKLDGVTQKDYTPVATRYVNSIIEWLQDKSGKLTTPKLGFYAQDNFMAYDINTSTYEALNEYLINKGSNLAQEIISKSEQDYLSSTVKSVNKTTRIEDITPDDVATSIEMSKRQNPINLGSTIGEDVDEVDIDTARLLDAFTGENESVSVESELGINSGLVSEEDKRTTDEILKGEISKDKATLEKYSENYDVQFNILNTIILRDYNIIKDKENTSDKHGYLVTKFKFGKFNNYISVSLTDFFNLLFGYYHGVARAKQQFSYVVNYANSILNKTVSSYVFPENIDKKFKSVFQYLVLESFSEAGASKDTRQNLGNTGQLWNAVKYIESVGETGKDETKPQIISKPIENIKEDFGGKTNKARAVDKMEPRLRSDVLSAIGMKATDDFNAGNINATLYQRIMLIISQTLEDGVFPSTVRADNRNSYIHESPLGQSGMPEGMIGALLRCYFNPLIEEILKLDLVKSASRV